MSEGSVDRPTPIRKDVEILPPNVTPIERGAEPQTSEPQSPGRRAFLKKAGGFVGGLAAVLGLATAAGDAANKLTESMQSPSTPSNPSEKEKHEREMRARGLPTNKGPENYDSFTLEQMAKIKAQNQAMTASSPSPKKEAN